MTTTDDPTPSQPVNDNPAPELTNPERRAALAKLGKLAWTAPTLVTLVISERAVGDGSTPPPDPPPGPV